VKKTFITSIISMSIIAAPVSGQLLINEICPANISIVQSNNGEFEDYIELHNSGSTTINLNGYGLSDQSDPASAFIFPDFNLLPDQKVLVFAAGTDAPPPVNHYEMPVSGTGSWKYIVGSASLSDDWMETDYDDGHWDTGNGGMGFGDGDDGTVVPTNCSVMMRKSFNLADSSEVLKAILMMDYDDGFIAYLNGTEIARSNMRFGFIRWNTYANASHEALMYQGLLPDSFPVDPVLLKASLRSGKNVLAVQTHNSDPASSDLSSIPFLIFGVKSDNREHPSPPSWFQANLLSSFSAEFKLSRTGETVFLFSPGGNIVDQQVFPAIESNHCYLRTSDGAAAWCLSDSPSPLSENNSPACYTGYTSSPVFSSTGGFYSVAQLLTISTSQVNGTVRYTRNGDDPQSSDPEFIGSIAIDSSQVIRARVFAPGYLPGRTVTHNYLIGEEGKLPVLTISTDSSNLWDENSGIYVAGNAADTLYPYYGANFWQDWHKPAFIEFYDKSRQRILNFNAEIEIYGNFSRTKPQKSFEIHLKDRYGTGEISYPLLPDKPHITNYDYIVLRNSGTDWNKVHFRDALMERIMRNTHSGYLASEPVRVFLNAADWGVYTMHEKHNHKWIESNYNLKEGEYDYLFEEGIYIHLEKGTDSEFWNMYDYATTQDPASQDYYEYMNSVLDIQNYADYFIAETYYNNGDWIGEWTNNIKLWRDNRPGGKWKYLMHDLDFGLGLQGSVNENRLELARNPLELSHSSEIFDAVLENQVFKQYFITRYADLINTIFTPANIEKEMKHFRDSMSLDMVYHFQKWGGDTASWNSTIQQMMNFVNARPAIARNHIRSQFALTNEVILSLDVSPPGAGRIEISTIVPETYPWSGIYFNGNPVTLTAIPNPGFSFDHWDANNPLGNGTSDQINVNFTADDNITAYFAGSAQDPQLKISEFNYNSHPDFKAGDWIELHNFGTYDLNISGWKLKDSEDHHIFTFPTGSTIKAGNYLVIAEDTLAFDLFFPEVQNRIGELGFSLNNINDQIRIFDHTGILHESFYFQSQIPWPEDANGAGFTCILNNYFSDPNDGANWSVACFGGSPGRESDTNLELKLPVTGNPFFCMGTPGLLSVSLIPNSTLQWQHNGNALSGATSDSVLVSSSGIYDARITAGACSGLSGQIVIEEKAVSAKPEVNDVTRCGTGEVLLTAYSQEPVLWYDAPGGNLLKMGEQFLTPELIESNTYYVTSGSVCPSVMVTVNAKIKPDCENTLAVYPNPVVSGSTITLQYDSPGSGVALIEIADCSGRLIHSSETEISEYNSGYELNVGELSQGIYVLSLEQDDKTHFTKFIKQ